ncbi:MAG: hypothetical protein A2745_01550 [Candidatus Harrisonbacteria bacterium RIFCSPHIGHO2_01_FULL_44_13]|uniref:N-acetyltransferase domain-containing protein n=1 Tax=Candidatus Harrisonbacteria bacterium RIFCSPLOWO2_01_FULL_44_18 TaxID=1798407 RepID=A0A1G1ZL39_9BACT|nr:MAG: hypothetical protein A2745_01550 [Candidatus Harrisonbacteria bacterium RIFCSPHIGHO2_01_FULL_44_13]OGY65225.1 MAG: hypothetical protein A3A16_00510 [Candidatus Harrisonbacteria bacterium RIFCSPLOWO2_01_FULL_44_18]
MDVTSRIVERINNLLRQLSVNAPYWTIGCFAEFLRQSNNHLVVAIDGKIIAGMGTVILSYSLMGRHARIEDVIVDKPYLGKGLGRKIVEELIRIANKEGARWIDLTSNSSRVGALKLYRSLGFKDVATNCLRLALGEQDSS